MDYKTEKLSASLRCIYGEARKGKTSQTPCNDYVSEKKLIRIFKLSINNDEIINQLRELENLGIKNDTVKQNLIEIIEHKINKLNGEEIRNYIKRFKEDNVLACIREIIGRQKSDEDNN